MTLENTAVVDMPAAGQETATSTDTNNEQENRYSGILDIDAPELDTTSNPGAETEGQTEGEGEAEEVDPWAGYEDVEIDGKVLKIPSDAKEYLLRQADYTRKTQAVSAKEKELVAKEQELVTKFQRSEDEFNAWTELKQINDQLKQVEGVDWNAEYNRLLNDPRQHEDYLAWQGDINKFQAIHMQFQQLQKKQAGLIDATRQFEHQRSEAAQQDIAKRLQETARFAQNNIKGWTPELDQKITGFALKELGYSPEILKSGINPANYKTLHLAYLGHLSQLRQQTARPSPNAPPPVATKTVSAKANAAISLDPETMSTEDYVKARQAGKLK
jgi:hypothetical protein